MNYFHLGTNAVLFTAIRIASLTFVHLSVLVEKACADDEKDDKMRTC
jgi:hypothetical protein